MFPRSGQNIINNSNDPMTSQLLMTHLVHQIIFVKIDLPGANTERKRGERERNGKAVLAMIVGTFLAYLCFCSI